jgi:hypothetical protein
MAGCWQLANYGRHASKVSPCLDIRRYYRAKPSGTELIGRDNLLIVLRPAPALSNGDCLCRVNYGQKGS